MKNYDLIIVGGCSAGIVAAINAGRRNPDMKIAILEKLPRIGKKLLATGNGKCNLTNETAAVHDYVGKEFVEYSSKGGNLTTSAGLSYTLSNPSACVRVFFDKRSVEVFVNDEFAASFSCSGSCVLLESQEKIIGTEYTLKSIWATN